MEVLRFFTTCENVKMGEVFFKNLILQKKTPLLKPKSTILHVDWQIFIEMFEWVIYIQSTAFPHWFPIPLKFNLFWAEVFW